MRGCAQSMKRSSVVPDRPVPTTKMGPCFIGQPRIARGRTFVAAPGLGEAGLLKCRARCSCESCTAERTERGPPEAGGGLSSDLGSRAPTPPEPPKPTTANAETKFDRATPPVAAREVDVPGSTPAGLRGVPRGRWQVGLEGLFASGVTPNPLAGFTLFGQLDGRSSAFWVPVVRLSASLGVSSWSSSVVTDPAEAHFAWMVASLDGCPFQIGDPLDLSVRPCARVTGGWLRSAGAGRANSPGR